MLESAEPMQPTVVYLGTHRRAKIPISVSCSHEINEFVFGDQYFKEGF